MRPAQILSIPSSTSWHSRVPTHNFPLAFLRLTEQSAVHRTRRVNRTHTWYIVGRRIRLKVSSELHMTSSSLGGYGSTYSSQAAQAALYAEMFSLKCDAGFFVVGLQEGEAVCTPIRVISTLITMSVASAWFSRRKSIKKLLLFFSHWLRCGSFSSSLIPLYSSLAGANAYTGSKSTPQATVYDKPARRIASYTHYA